MFFPEIISGETHVFPENYAIGVDVCPDLISGKTETFSAEQQDSDSGLASSSITFHEFNPANVVSCEDITIGNTTLPPSCGRKEVKARQMLHQKALVVGQEFLLRS